MVINLSFQIPDKEAYCIFLCFSSIEPNVTEFGFTVEALLMDRNPTAHKISGVLK